MIEWLGKNRQISAIFLALIALEIFVISSISGGPIAPGLDFSWLYHFSAFFLLNFFFLTSVISNKKFTGKKLVMVLIFSVIYAVLDEIHQFFVPMRNPALTDVLMDSIGIFSSSLVYMHYIKVKKV